MGSIANDQQIPVIDISAANKDGPKQLLDAACRFGFVFVANNQAGISPSLIADVFDLTKDLFALPKEVKQVVAVNGNYRGWLSQGVETLDPQHQSRPDVKEAFNMGIQVDGRFDQALPQLLQKKKNHDNLVAFQIACHDLCQRVLEAFAIALEIDKEWFTSRHDASKGPVGSVFRLLYYPKQTELQDDVDIRAGAHSDYGSITCLFQLPGQPGLELKTPSGDWTAVPVDPLGVGNTADLPILVNIGDLLEDWTGGLLKSTMHRVVFPKQDGGDRYSIAYFCHPLDEALMEPVPSKAVEEHAKLHGSKTGVSNGKVITAGEHLSNRLLATYNVK